MTIDLKQGTDGVWAGTGGEVPVPSKPASEPEIPLKTPTVDYNEIVQPTLCSANKCKNGHEWQPVIQLARCPGCGSPLLAVKMLNCPICNEPVEAFRLRSDHLPQGGAIMPMCRGSQTLAEVQVIEMKRQAAADEEKNHVERSMISKP